MGKLYTPQFVQAFGSVKNSDVNTNLSLIRDAFNNLSAVDSTGGGYTFVSTGGVSNVLVDLSAVGYSGFNYVSVTLPAFAAVGDPPVTVTVGQGSTVGTVVSSCQVLGGGTPIMGIVSANGQPFLTASGDSLTFQYVGGTCGWAITNSSLSALATPLGVTTVQGWNATNLVAFHRLEQVVDTTALAYTGLLLDGINVPGLWTAFTQAPGSLPKTLNVAGTINGAAGYVIPVTPNIRHLFTCIATNNFVRTT
jgi:hypothetical protein